MSSKRKKEYSPPVYIGQNVYIKPNYIVSVPEYHYENKGRSAAFEANKVNLENNSHNGKLSAKAISNIKNAINWMLVSARKKRVFSVKHQSHFYFKVAFITLTLPDTDQPVNEKKFSQDLLNPFLVYLRKYHQLKNYVWKMEYQQNGKLHCHITIDTFVHWRDIRKTWNRLLSRNGLLSAFERANGHADPNSTDIHSIKKIKNLAAYLAKYMAKDNVLKKIVNGVEKEYIPTLSGRIWSCSYELSRAKECKVHIPADQAAHELKCLFDKEIEYKDLTREHPLTKEQTKVGELYFIRANFWQSKIRGVIKAAYQNMCEKIQSAARHFTEYELSL